jgi:hypothetical protein
MSAETSKETCKRMSSFDCRTKVKEEAARIRQRTTVTLLRLIHEGQTAFNAIRPTTCAISRIKTFAFLIAFVLSDDRCYCDHRRQICWAMTSQFEVLCYDEDFENVNMYYLDYCKHYTVTTLL